MKAKKLMLFVAVPVLGLALGIGIAWATESLTPSPLVVTLGWVEEYQWWNGGAYLTAEDLEAETSYLLRPVNFAGSVDDIGIGGTWGFDPPYYNWDNEDQNGTKQVFVDVITDEEGGKCACTIELWTDGDGDGEIEAGDTRQAWVWMAGNP